MFLFFYTPATTCSYTLSLHDALPIFAACYAFPHRASDKGIFDHPHEAGTAYNSISAVRFAELAIEKQLKRRGGRDSAAHPIRSEEHTSELQSRENLVCRLLLEKKKKK